MQSRIDRETAIPILAYHQVVRDTSEITNVPWGNVRDFTLLAEFEVQMRYLSENGFTAITLEDFQDARQRRSQLPDKPVMITFDDGRLNVLENAFPVMASYAFIGTAYIVSDLANGAQAATGHPAIAKNMHWSDLDVLKSDGWLIGSHTKTHRGLHASPPSVILSELTESKDAIEYHMQRPCRHFAYPGGYRTDSAEQLVGSVYDTARLWNFRGRYQYPSLESDPLRLGSMNVSYHLPFGDFVSLVEQNNPTMDYQWNRLRVELSRGDYNRLTLWDIATMPRLVLEHFGLTPPHLHEVTRWIRNRVEGK